MEPEPGLNEYGEAVPGEGEPEQIKVELRAI